MKIRISTISPEGLKVVDTIPVAALNARMNEGSPSEIIFASDPKVNLVVHRKPNGAETSGTVTSRFRQPCSRCDESLERETETRVDYILKRREETETVSDDIGIVFFEGDHFDLEDLIQESIILSLSLYWSPPILSSGKCSGCQVSYCSPADSPAMASTTKMADLLQKASKKRPQKKRAPN